MSKHSQRPDKRQLVCVHCKIAECYDCVDVIRAVYTDVTICECTRLNHSGDPTNVQIKDPDTGTVFGPNSVIKEDGTVITDEEFREQWRKSFPNYG